MAAVAVKVEPARIRIRLLEEGNPVDTQGFSCGTDADSEELNAFLRDDALRFSEERIGATYVAEYDGTKGIAGYVTVCADAVVLETKERKSLWRRALERPTPMSVPAIEIGRLAVAGVFKEVHAGMGTALIAFVVGLAFGVNERVSARLITLDAFAGAIGFYEKLGFVRNEAKEYRKRARTSMRLNPYSPELSPRLQAFVRDWASPRQRISRAARPTPPPSRPRRASAPVRAAIEDALRGAQLPIEPPPVHVPLASGREPRAAHRSTTQARRATSAALMTLLAQRPCLELQD